MRRKKDGRWAADCKGFSLHAGVSFGELDRKGKDRLVRYCARPPLAMERLSVLRNGAVAYKLNWTNSRSSHRVMTPMEFIERLVSIVAPPRLPLTRFHGVLAPNSSWRREIASVTRRSDDESEPRCAEQAHARPKARASVAAMGTGTDRQSSAPAVLPPVAAKAEGSGTDPPTPRSRTSTSYVPRARLMRSTRAPSDVTTDQCASLTTRSRDTPARSWLRASTTCRPGASRR